MENNRETLKYITSLVLFGMNGILASQVKTDSLIIVLFRTFSGSVVLFIAFMIKNKRIQWNKNKTDKLWLFLSGVAMGFGWLFLYDAFQSLGVGMATMTYYFGPAIVILAAPLCLNEKISKSKIGAFFIVLVGMVFLMIQTMNQTVAVRGVIAGLSAAICYALMIILGRKNKKVEGIECALYQMLGAFGVVMLFALMKGWSIPTLTGKGWVSLLILGIVNTGFGCYLYFSAIPHLNIQTVAILGYLEPLSAVILGMVFLGERMTMVQLTGVVFILAGAYLGERKKDIRVDIPSSV